MAGLPEAVASVFQFIAELLGFSWPGKHQRESDAAQVVSWIRWMMLALVILAVALAWVVSS